MTRFIKPVVRYKDMLETSVFFKVMERDAQNNLVAVDLTGFTAKFTMVQDGTTTKKIDDVDMVIDPDQVANTGQLQYNWVVGDLDTLGNFKGYIKLIDSSARPAGFPEDAVPIIVKGFD